VDLIASLSAGARETIILATEAGATEETGFQINLFWVVVQALTFLLFLAILYLVAFRRIGGVLESRRSAIEQGLQDAEQARRDRENAEAERVATLNEARREANDLLARAQKVAEETRAADIAATREELERLRTNAAAEIEAEKQRAMGELRAEVADLAIAAASKVVGESLTGQRQRRLVEEFLTEATPGGDRKKR
jgi:F-type H+-transporting ATPase subunit b